MIKIIIFTYFYYVINAYQPTAIIHGIMFNSSDTMTFLRDTIRNAQPGSVVDVLELMYGTESYYPMWIQVSRFQERFLQFVDENVRANRPGPYNLIGYSQGGLIARAVLETLPNHTVSRFISLSSPQNGFHGELFTPNSTFSVGNEEKFSGSVAGYWKHPRDMIRYKKEGRFLATLNNEYKHKLNTQFRNSLCKLDQFVMIGGPDDGVVVPWQSSIFGYDDANGGIINMEQQPCFINDCICLNYLNQKGAITQYTVPGVRHPDWHNNLTVIQNYILPHLI